MNKQIKALRERTLLTDDGVRKIIRDTLGIPSQIKLSYSWDDLQGWLAIAKAQQDKIFNDKDLYVRDRNMAVSSQKDLYESFIPIAKALEEE